MPDTLVRHAFVDAPVAMLRCTAEGEVQATNDAFDMLLGHPAGALVGRPLFDVTHPEDIPRARAACTDLNEHGGVVRFEGRLLAPPGEPVAVRIVSRLVDRDGGRHIVMVVEDHTSHREVQERLRHEALHDPLTGLANRRLFDERLAEALAAGGPVALLYLDIDGFKQVNDHHGHPLGDAVLQTVARRLLAATRPTDTPCRLGGDEFAVVLPGLPADGVPAFVGRLRARVERPLRDLATDLVPRLAVGAATVRPGDTAVELVRRADRDMYRAKLSSRA